MFNNTKQSIKENKEKIKVIENLFRSENKFSNYFFPKSLFYVNVLTNIIIKGEIYLVIHDLN